MDEEELNSKLSNRIREVFDHYQDTTADEGWALLRQKFPEEKKDRGLAWLWYAAAAIVLLCLGLWVMQKPAEQKGMVAKNQHPIVKPNTQPIQPAVVDSAQQHQQNNAPAIVTTPQQVKPAIKNQASPNNVAQMAGLSNKSQQKANDLTRPVAGAAPVITTVNTVVKPIQEERIANNIKTDSPAINTVNVIANVPKAVDSAIITNNAAKYAATNPPQPNKPSSAEAMNKLLAENAMAKNAADKKLNSGAKKTMFSVYAATYFNYAKGSDNNVNVGAGFTSDFKLTKKLKLSTGVSIAQNTLKYNSNNPLTNASTNDALAASPALTALDKVQTSTPNTNNFIKSAGIAQTSFSVAVNIPPTLKDYNASLIGLDIPINLKYQFSTQSDAFISAGLSSGTYINETYTLNYLYAKSDQQSTTKASFNSFDFAKTLNVSFGMGYPLGKSNRLIVEPFLKYPLDGLGLQQIKFGAGGINLKLNFQSAKK
jgi:hypothetical protein